MVKLLRFERERLFDNNFENVGADIIRQKNRKKLKRNHVNQNMMYKTNIVEMGTGRGDPSPTQWILTFMLKLKLCKIKPIKKIKQN